jgi:O-antigen/teichoic acid export membrane protein
MLSRRAIFSRIFSVGEIQRQSLISFSGQITLTIIGFLGTVYFARTVGAAALGAYSLFMAYYSIIGMVTDGGFGGAATKKISEGEEQNAYFSAFLCLRTLFTFVVLVALFICRKYFVDLNDAGIFLWLLIALVLSVFYGALYTGIAGLGKMGIYAVGTNLGEVSRVFFQIIAVFLGYGVAGLAGGFVLGMATAALFSYKFFEFHLVHFNWKHIKALSTFSFWLFLTSSGILMYSYTDRVLIGYYLNNTEVGIYQIAIQLSSLASFATVALRSTLWPKVSRWGKTGDIELIEKSLSKALIYSLALAVPAMTGGILLGKNLLYFLYAPEFSAAYLVLALVLVAQVVNVFQYLFTAYLGALGFQKESFKATIVGAVGNVVLNLILIPIMGINGAAFATLVTLAFNAFLAFIFLSKKIRIKIEYSNLLNIFIASCVMGFSVWVYLRLFTVSSTLMTIIPVFFGALLYITLMLKIDPNLNKEFQEIIMWKQ